IEKGYKDSYSFKNIYSLSNISNKKVDGEKFWTIPVKTKDRNGNEISFNLDGRQKDTSLLKLIDDKGNKLNFNENIITDSLAKKLGVIEGATITIESDIDDSIITVKIDKIAKSYLGQTVYIPLEKLYEETKIPKDSYIGVISDKDLEFSEGEVSSVTSKESMLAGVEGLVAPLKGMMIFIGVLASVIGMAMIYVITTMVIDENKVNISMFKIMGYQNEKLTKIILNTNDMLVIGGFLISIPLSKYFISELFEEVTKNLDFSIKAELALSSILIVFVILMSVYYIAKRLSRKKVLNISMEEVLKNGRE
ncbi:MAG: ABC transporter permease, partial [Clostridium sp.]